MNVSFLEAFDFNRMLVVSVFFHLSFMIVAMFLPKPGFTPDVVVPAFMVSLVELPPTTKSAAKKVSPVAKQSTATKTLLEKLEQLAGNTRPPEKTISNPLLQELDQLAKLIPPVPEKKVAAKKNRSRDKVLKELQELKRKKAALLPPPKSWKLKKPPIVEETLDELKQQSDKLKKAKITPDKVKPAIITEENIKEPGAEAPPQIKSNSPKEQSSDMEFAELSKMDIKKEETGGQTAEELLAELEALSGYTEAAPAGENEGAIQPVLQKMASLPKTRKNIEIEFSTPSQKAFKSAIGKPRTLPKIAKETPGPLAKSTEGAPAPSGDIDAANALSLYVGVVHKRIYEYWKTPLGTEHDDLVEVSFYLYPKGNIDKPLLVKASKEGKLNTLAVQAIYDAVPFPEFPPEVKESNLHIKVNFKYKPANG